jgi:16S rRNA (cytidine1402-2'-O)-methyltransferase
MTKGTLYIIPVPICNFTEENPYLIYPMLQSIVNSLDEFIVEDFKTARHCLRKIGYHGEFDKTVFHLLNEHTDLQSIGDFLSSAENGKNIGLMSEAGMPCIADPGSEIVLLAHKKNIRVVPLYGPSSIFLALAASGLNGQNFIFHGYLPKQQSQRKKKLKEINQEIKEIHTYTHIFIETPYRNNHLLEDILSTCSPDILLCLAINITGIEERIITKTILEWRSVKLPDLNKQPAVFLLGSNKQR